MSSEINPETKERLIDAIVSLAALRGMIFSDSPFKEDCIIAHNQQIETLIEILGSDPRFERYCE